jgi:Ran GTPase-activating protein (RanGAP) involved in mRNA processing and transport
VCLQINPGVRQFDLSNNTIGDVGAKALAAALADDFSLHELRLSGNVDIGDDGVRALADALTHNTTLRSMQLTGCTLNDVSIVALASALRANARLNELQLHRSAGIVTDVGIRALALALCAPDTPLTALTLAGAQIGEKGMVYLTRALLFNERLKQLSLGTLPVGAAAGDVTAASRLGEACVVSMRCALAVNAALTEYDGPGAPLLPIAERQHHRETYLFSKLSSSFQCFDPFSCFEFGITI